MAIISFPVERVTGIIESNAYSNLKNFIAICDDNRTLEFYAGTAEECQEKGFLNPGEFEKLTEQIRARRLENARPEEKPAVIPEKPGLYCSLRKWENRSQSARSKQSGAIMADITISTLPYS